jgi:biotin carboxyl carrier protein
MQFDMEIGGRERRVVVTRTGAAFAVTVDGRTHHVDAARLDAHTLSLIVDTVWPKDATIAVDGAAGQLSVVIDGVPITVALNGGRRRRRDDGGHAGSGPQRVLAPMPGKIVRVLVRNGDTVAARQPVVVVEAMKMENELRAARNGTVAEVHAREGQSVDAGALLVMIQ